MASDELMDNIHHALGRPLNASVEPYRNRYCVEFTSPTARAFARSPYWELGDIINNGTMGIFFVTDEGIAALWPWLAAKQKAEGRRVYAVTFDDGDRHLVQAKSRSAAIYSRYLDISDVRHDMTFRDFLDMEPRARLAA